ncbi:MAG TPA: UDP-N-acetylmuramoyl-L-alanine--D-glutamate ligase [Gemmatimonadales bacterium]|nr:UDP-N-acetylmuramoyl-L-alanine--D-glutamate ligase [Gemmatimonadales bacterium]
MSEVAVIGLGRSGIAATRLLVRDKKAVYASDADPHPEAHSGVALDSLRDLRDVTVQLGGHDLARIKQSELVVVSPGVPPAAPPLAAARAASVPIISELDLGFQHLRATRCIAVTGTNGKTTTTALVKHLLIQGGVESEAAGNIGRPLAEVALAPDRYSWLAVEVSSFQLHDSPHFAPAVGVMTNLAPDHLDRYSSVAEYYADKQLLFRNAADKSVWVLNGDDRAVLGMARSVRGERRLFSLRGRADAWYDRARHVLRFGDEVLLGRDDLKLLGDHNVANALAAALAVREAGVAADAIARGLSSFHPLPHRLEPVREVGGVLWVNDSKATNIASTVVAIEAMTRPFVLLLGGRHKGEPYTRLGDLLRQTGRCRLVIAYGEAGPLVEQHLAGQVPLERGTTFENVVARARRAAKPGDVILLSPACSSYDMFHNYEERGARFRALAETA